MSRSLLLVVLLVAAGGFGGIALAPTIDQTSVSLYAGICIADWRHLIVAGEGHHWGDITGFRAVGPWSHGHRYCAGSRPS